MTVLVNGIGNLGTTLLHLLADFRQELGINRILALKNRPPAPWDLAELARLQERGIELCYRDKPEPDQQDSGRPELPMESRLRFLELSREEADIHYVFDTCAAGMGLDNKAWYQGLPALKGACAQGTEGSFGVPFMTGYGFSVAKAPYVRIVSCNTHALGALLRTFGGPGLDNLAEADFVVVRRCEDLGNHQRLVSANVAARHRDPEAGTHHAAGVRELYQHWGLELEVQSSDITTPSQLMHGVRFSLDLKEARTPEALQAVATQDPWVSTTGLFDSNRLFEAGRRYGPYGRIYSQAIVLDNNLLFQKGGRRVKGWAFIPQEGNTLPSTLEAFLQQTGQPRAGKVMEALRRKLVQAHW